MTVRLASEGDLPAIEAIYNQAVRRRFCTADLQPLGMDRRRMWLLAHEPMQFPVFVYEEDQIVLGWVALSAYRPGREALKDVAEISYYVDESRQNSGIGSRLVEYAILAARKLAKRVLLAIIIEGNQASICLVEKYGFEKWGYLPEAILVEGETRGHIYMGKLLKSESIKS